MKTFFFGLVLFAAASISVAADEPVEHKMSLRWLRPPHSRAYRVMHLDDADYETTDDLKSAVAHLPAGSKLTWYTGCFLPLCLPLGSAPYSPLEDFEKFCSERKVVFTTDNAGSW